MKMIKQEFINIYKNKILLISVIAITFIPILYAGFFDKSVWDPYGMAKDLPVAVVNEDVPVTLMGQKLSVGEQVVDQLKDNKDLKWEFVSQEEADKGMKDLYYYMIVTIPKDFSKDAGSLLDKQPKKMEITYTTNGSLNYIGEEIAKIGATTLESQVRDNVTEAYTTALVKAGEDAVGSVKEASNGSSQLASGTKELKSGLTQYTSGVGQAFSGSNQLSSGTNELASNVGPLQSGVTELNSGANQLSSGLAEVNGKMQPLGSKVGQLQGGLNELMAGSKELEVALQGIENSLDSSSTQTINQNINTIKKDVDNMLANTQELTKISVEAGAVSNQLTDLNNDLSNMSANLEVHSEGLQAEIDQLIAAQEGIDEAIKIQLVQEINGKLISFEQATNAKIAAETSQLSGKVNEVIVASNALAQQAEALSQLSTGIATNANHISGSINELEKGTNDMMAVLNMTPASGNATQMVQGLERSLSDVNSLVGEVPVALGGVNQLANGSSQLSTGLGQMYGQMPTLVSGVSQLNSGASQLTSGLSELNKNSPQLMSGIGQLNTGSDQLASALNEASDVASKVKVTEKHIEMFADPTDLQLSEFSKVKNYGQALAPYIMSLALFVGCLVFNFVFPIRRVSMQGQSSRDWWLSKVALGFVVSTCMALIEATIMLALKLPVAQLGRFYLMALISAWCYMFLVMFLAMAFDNPGRFIAMIILVLQLGGAGGTFPMPLTNSFFNAIHPYLPMSYSIYGFRQAISGGIGDPMFHKSVTVLVITFIVFVILLGLAMNWLQKRHLSDHSDLDDNQKLQALEI